MSDVPVVAVRLAVPVAEVVTEIGRTASPLSDAVKSSGASVTPVGSSSSHATTVTHTTRAAKAKRDLMNASGTGGLRWRRTMPRRDRWRHRYPRVQPDLGLLSIIGSAPRVLTSPTRQVIVYCGLICPRI